MMTGKMMEQCQEMKQQKMKLKEDMKAQDAQLIQQLGNMNRAAKNDKLDMIATIITAMAEKRMLMDARKEKMQEEMMQHMMQHMSMGAASMAQCPMMKVMDAKPAGEHSEHH